MAIKLAMVSPSRLFCEGIRKLIEDDPEIDIIGSSALATENRDGYLFSCDVVLVDHPALFGIWKQCINQDNANTKLILIQNRVEPLLVESEVVDLISKGVMAGVLSADTSGELLKKAIKVVASGELWLGHVTIKSILTQASAFKQNITRQESEIAGLILKGYCNKEIAKELKITEATVKSHCNRLFKKFKVSGRLQLGLKLRGLYEDRNAMLPA